MINEIREYKLYLFDLDDTLTHSISGEKFPQTVEDREFLPGRFEHLLELANQGKNTCIVTNQGGAAWGIFQKTDMHNFLASLCKAADIRLYLVCFHDTSPKARLSDRTIKELVVSDVYGEWDRRKPGPGMLIQAMDHFRIDQYDTLMVGDRPEDQAAAAAAGVDFAWAWDFFKDGPIIV